MMSVNIGCALTWTPLAYSAEEQNMLTDNRRCDIVDNQMIGGST